MEEKRIFNILNAMNSCELDERQLRYKSPNSPWFLRPVFDRDYEMFEEILEMKSQIQYLPSIPIWKL